MRNLIRKSCFFPCLMDFHIHDWSTSFIPKICGSARLVYAVSKSNCHRWNEAIIEIDPLSPFIFVLADFAFEVGATECSVTCWSIWYRFQLPSPYHTRQKAWPTHILSIKEKTEMKEYGGCFIFIWFWMENIPKYGIWEKFTHIWDLVNLKIPNSTK